jgi:hypothetical protein
MTGHAFQFLVTDNDLRASLAAIHAALREGGRFVFETRHPQAQAWQDWNPSNRSDIIGPAGRALRVWHEVESVDSDVVTFTGTTAEPNGPVLRVDRTSLRFLDPEALSTFLDVVGFQIEAQYGDWCRAPIPPAGDHHRRPQIELTASALSPARSSETGSSTRWAMAGGRPAGYDLAASPGG